MSSPATFAGMKSWRLGLVLVVGEEEEAESRPSSTVRRTYSRARSALSWKGNGMCRKWE